MKSFVFSVALLFAALHSCDAQTRALPPGAVKTITLNHLRPVQEVDTLSKGFPRNSTTPSGWHIEYHASITQNDGPPQLNLYTLIFNDRVSSSLIQSRRPGTLTNDSMRLSRETPDFLFFSEPNDSDLLVVSKKEDDYWNTFLHLLNSDFEHGIFIRYNPYFLYPERKMVHPSFMTTNINTNIRNAIEVHFKGYCDAEQTTHCISSITYENGWLAMTATVKKRKHSKKLVKEVQRIKI